MKRLFGVWSLFALVGVLLIMAAGAFAADPAVPIVAAPAVTSPAPAALANFLSGTVFPIIGSLLMGVIALFINRLGAKFKIDALTQKDNFLTQLAFQGVTMAEEKAAQMVGSKAALTGSDKLDLAVSHILSVMPQVTPARAKAITEATLAQIPGLGATGSQAFQLGPIFTALAGELSKESIPETPAPAAA